MQATFPYLAGWRNSSFRLEGQSLDIPRSITGAETVRATMRGRWAMSGEVVIHGEAAYLQWQAFLATMQGRLGTTLVPANTRFRPKDRNGRELAFIDTASLADAQTWEHFGFENTQLNRITLASAAALRATQLNLSIFDTTGIRPGQFFSIGERLYRVVSHWEPTAGAHRILIEPPLRAAAPAGTRLEIEKPVCRMRFASEMDGAFAQDYADFAPKIQFQMVEAI